MRFSLPTLLLMCAAPLLAGCVRNVHVPQTTPQYGLQLRVSLPPITPGTDLDGLRASVELINDNDIPFTVSSPAQIQATLPVVRADGQLLQWQLRMLRAKDVRITIPAHGTYRTTYELPLDRFAGATRETYVGEYQLQLFYHPRVYSPSGSFARVIEIPSNKLRF